MEEIKTEQEISFIEKTEETDGKTFETGAKEYPLVALRGKVLFPNTILNFDVGRPVSVSAIEEARVYDNYLFIATQKNAFIDNPTKRDINNVGVIAKIKQVAKLSNGNMKVSVEALRRGRITLFTQDKGCFKVMAEAYPYEDHAIAEEVEAYFRVAKGAFYEFTLFEKRITKDMLSTITAISNPNNFIDNAMSLVNLKEEDCLNILETTETKDRLIAFEKLFSKEVEIAKIEKRIASKVRTNIDESQKEFYLREQLKAIHSELGDEDDGNELKERIKEKKLPKEIEEKALKEVERLDKINPSSPDYSIILNYLDWLLGVPFNECTEDNNDLKKAKEILDKDHFGLQKVKDRIVEYIAVLQLTKKIKGPIICFVGPPGVGKTSVASSIARALNRKFIRMSLGGVKDEAEIRGHRRTYVGAMPGRIIYGMKNVGVNNPVFLLDEIDKLSSDIHGDPASALLEVLDPEQNSTFRDRFLEIPYDLSKVMFITTANSVDTIPYPLLDRMEIIELSGYTQEEKFEIAKRYLIPKQLVENGLTKKNIEIKDEAIKEIISGYTMEAGVRNLEREIGSLIRKVATKFAEKHRLKKQIINKEDVEGYLGKRKRLLDITMEQDEVGATTGLAWTSIGGTTLTIEVVLMKGKGDIVLTGKLGDVMKESAKTALSYIHANAEKYNIDEKLFSERDIHIHVPEGATPKDGPSAGITMATAILSALTNKPVRCDIAMTGEITLRGKVLPIGGLKEKSLAAFRQGIKTIIIPYGNEKDLDDIPQEIRKEIDFIPVKTVETVFNTAIRL
ncbi:MAG: endopeptidase La [Clostridia bacterium]|nr:endopeptidase La [Clostridia bacterium]MBQ9514313.1 endopeptidase La [Clostridia bacterium]